MTPKPNAYQAKVAFAQPDVMKAQVAQLQGQERNNSMKRTIWKASPMCTPSTEVEGWCRFGGDLLLGDVVVGR